MAGDFRITQHEIDLENFGCALVLVVVVLFVFGGTVAHQLGRGWAEGVAAVESRR